MKNKMIKTKPHVFHGKPHMKIKRVKLNPRTRMRQALKACLPFLNLKLKTQSGK